MSGRGSKGKEEERKSSSSKKLSKEIPWEMTTKTLKESRRPVISQEMTKSVLRESLLLQRRKKFVTKVPTESLPRSIPKKILGSKESLDTG